MEVNFEEIDTNNRKFFHILETFIMVLDESLRA